MSRARPCASGCLGQVRRHGKEPLHDGLVLEVLGYPIVEVSDVGVVQPRPLLSHDHIPQANLNVWATSFMPFVTKYSRKTSLGGQLL